MSNESWYAGSPKNMIRLWDIYGADDRDDYTVDYDVERKMYRVTVFKDNHFKDEFWFDAFDEEA